MSTIRAKQEICLNICSIRCLSNYAIGRYCLRFCLYQTSTKDNIPIHSKQQPTYQYSSNHRYAIPINVIQYNNKNASSPLIPQSGNNYNNTNTIQQISQHIYTTKPFLLKSNAQTPINELCIFKYDINIFNNKYETDFHQITMRCICQLFAYDYNSGQGRVIATFDGRLKGAGVSDALLIDFYDSVGCQVLGTIHSCIYQFQYVYSGGPVQLEVGGGIKNADMSTMKNSISMNNQVLPNSNSYYSRQHNSEGYNNSIVQRNKRIIMPSMTFQMYCQLQSKQYVQSLLQYLLSEVKKSEQKMSLNLQIFSSIIQPPIHKLSQLQTPPTQSLNHQQPFLQSQQIQQSTLQKSIRSQLNLDLQSISNTEMKQKLSIIKKQSKYYDNGNNYNCQQQQMEIVLDDSIEQSKNIIEKGKIKQQSKKQQKYKQKNQQQFCIVLDQQQQQIWQMDKNNKYNYKNNTNNIQVNTTQQIKKIKNNNNNIPLSININPQQKQTIHKQSIPQKQSPIFINFNTNITVPNKATNNNSESNEVNINLYKKQQQTNKNKKRRRIFVQSNQNQSKPINYNKDNIYNSNNNEYGLQHEFQQFQLTNKQSFYQSRQIPKANIRYHPNHAISTSNTTNHINSPFNSLYTSKNIQNTSKVTIQQFQKLLHQNCISIYEKWRLFISYLTKPQSYMLFQAYHLQYRNKLTNLLGQSVIRFKGSFDIDIYSKEQMQRNKMAYQIRQQVKDNEKNIKINQFKFYNKQLFSKNKPIMFQQNYCKSYPTQIQQTNVKMNKKSFIKLSLNLSTNVQNQSKHFIFLVHGLGACRIDMEKLRIQMKRYFKQKVNIVLSCANQGRTEGDITLMGVRLSHEVDQQLSKHYKNVNNLQSSKIKISFFGHSMGGIIIRSALPRLQKYKNLFHSFVSLSSPHVGYNYSSSKLIDVGLWLINNWKKCQSILQLTMSDTPTSNSSQKLKSSLQDTFLYKLSLQKGLEWFKKIIFLASRQDLYVPYFSARIQKHQQCLNDLRYNNQYAIIHSKMVDNILSRATGSITRIDVNFSITQQSVDNLIGRAAHLNFVSSTQFLRLLCATDQETII